MQLTIQSNSWRLGLVLVVCALARVAVGQDSGEVARSSAGSGDQSPVQFGIAGHYRAGCWTAVSLREAPKANTEASKGNTGVVALETLDGEGLIL